jgi:VWFA-related protein
MKRTVYLLAIFISINLLFAHQEQHAVTVRNIEVPVRVFMDKQFVDNLTIDDFEIYENGVLQKIEALYLANKNNIARQEELTAYSPQTIRHYYLLFQIIEYNPKLEASIEHFFKNVLLAQDTVTLMTPQKSYHLSSEALQRKKREAISKEMLKILRKDTKISSSAYRSSMNSLRGLVSAISGSSSMTSFDGTSDLDQGASSLGMLLRRYRNNLNKLEDLRIVDQNVFIQFATQVKSIPGQKQVYFFYEREFRPELSTTVVNNLVANYQDEPSVLGDIQDLFQFYQRYERVNQERISQAFADASICFNFLFVDRQERSAGGITMREQSEDFFSAFKKTAQATGGIVDTSTNPSAAFQNALKAGENYYLLYYSPANYTSDGSYKKIEVRVKNPKCKVTFRQGYISN